jgi:hypothetical protein
MATLTVPQLIAATNCDLCKIPPGLLPYAILAGLLDILRGVPVPTDPQTLISEANCLLCALSPGMVPYATLAALRSLSTSGVFNAVMYGIANPTVPPTSGSGIFYNTATGAVWIWNAATAAWDPIIL